MGCALHAGQQVEQYHPCNSSGMCNRFGQFPQMSQQPFTRSEMWQLGLMNRTLSSPRAKDVGNCTSRYHGTSC